jgi:hypothetical protein
VPADECFGLNVDESGFPVEEIGQKQHRQPRGIIESARLNFPFLVERQLVAQEQNLGRERSLRPSGQLHEPECFAHQVLQDMKDSADRVEDFHACPRIPRSIGYKQDQF